MSKTSTKKYKYSKIQYFFWLLSGAEISILKDCPTDYNRQAGIGFTIFMTTLLAFFSGSYAGYYFGESYLSAVIFGIIWASLIFSIDRSMVVTLKKDPTKEKQNFWAPFLSRAVLAILIAFIISIPLELLIFRDNIDIHKPKFKQDKILNIQYGRNAIEDIDGKKESSATIQIEINELSTELGKGEPQNDAEYDDIKKQFKIVEIEYNTRNNKYKNLDNSAKRAYNAGNMQNYNDLSIARRNAKNERDRFYQKVLNPKREKYRNYLNDWKKKMSAEIIDKRQNKTEIDKTIRSGQNKVSNSGKEMDSLMTKHNNSFVFNFMVLEDLARPTKMVLKPVEEKRINSDSVSITQLDVASSSLDKNTVTSKMKYVNEYDSEGATIFFLLWLIRILFFTIEILPTIAKIATPFGAYDRAIYRKEKDLELELDQRTSEYLLQQQKLREIEFEAEQKQLKDRVKIENELHKELITEIASVQNEVARKKIEDFKNKNLYYGI